jgi:hypothetical protein
MMPMLHSSMAVALPEPITPYFLLMGVLIPSAVALLMLLIGRRLGGMSAWVPALAIAAGILLGFVVAMPHKPLPALRLSGLRPGSDWTYCLVYPLALLGLLDALTKVSLWVRLIGSLAVAWGVVLLIAGGRLSYGMMALLAGAIWALTISTEALATRRRGALAPLVLWAVTSASSAVVMMSNSADGGRIALLLAGVLGAAVLTAWIFREIRFARGVSIQIVPLIAALLLSTDLYALDNFLWPNAALLAAGLATAWVGELPPLRSTISLAATMIPLAIVGARAAAEFQRAQQSQSADEAL